MWTMSGPLCDWMAAVIRGCRSLALMVSSVTSAPRALEASTICFLSSTSQAGMKSTQRVMCSFVPCAKAGARWAARIPATPVSFRNERRLIECLPLPGLSALVDLLEFALGPRDRVLRLRALHGLGVHVDDDVLRVRLGRLGRCWPGMSEGERLPHRLSEDLQWLVDLAPHRVLFPHLGGAHRVPFVHHEPLLVVVLLVQPAEEVLRQLLVLAVLHDRMLLAAVEGELAGRPRRHQRGVLDVLPEGLALVVLDLVLLALGHDVDGRPV